MGIQCDMLAGMHGMLHGFVIRHGVGRWFQASNMTGMYSLRIQHEFSG